MRKETHGMDEQKQIPWFSDIPLLSPDDCGSGSLGSFFLGVGKGLVRSL